MKTTSKVAAKKSAQKVAAPKKIAAKKSAVKKVTAKKSAPSVKVAPKKNVNPDDGITFPDPGFHIAVLGALLDAKAMGPRRIRASLEALESDELGDDETARLVAAMKCLHAIKLDPKKVAHIESLDFDGGNEIYMMLEDGAGVETGGEDDTYCLLSIDGIAALSRLKNLNLDGHGYRRETLDLRPVAGHPALETLVLTGKCKGAKALESLPKLRKIALLAGSVDAPAVLDRLAKRGVEIAR